MRAFPTVATAIAVAAVPPAGHQAAPPPSGAPHDREVLGREQASPWIPVAMLTATSIARRRELLLAYIRREIAARRSSIDAGEVDRVLAAMRTLDRERFVPPSERRRAYLPMSVGIGEGQTLSDAYLVTVMAAAARVGRDDRVLDIGTGSGFQAALLDRLGGRVTSIEIIPALAAEARARLRRMGLGRIVVVTGDGAAGYAPGAPFDAILVAAGATGFPAPLLAQLAPGGRLVMPIGPTQAAEQLLVATREASGAVSVCSLGLAAAVPLTGDTAAHAPQRVADPPRWCFARPVT